jgi:hypothetical protein
VWNYRLKYYDTTTGSIIDSSNFSLTVVGQNTVNGATYFELQNSGTGNDYWLTNLNSTTIGSIDSVNSVQYYTLFASGTGDSVSSISSWPVSISGTCTGMDYLYAYYADTTLINLDGTVYSNSIKNVVVLTDCSGTPVLAQVYFVKQGLGLVRYVQYVISPNNTLLLQLAWVLESETLTQ